MGTPVTYNRTANRTYTGLIPALFDKIEVAYPNDTTEVYTYSLFDPNSETYLVQAIISVVYTDSTKDCLSSVTKTFNAEES